VALEEATIFKILLLEEAEAEANKTLETENLEQLGKAMLGVGELKAPIIPLVVVVALVGLEQRQLPLQEALLVLAEQGFQTLLAERLYFMQEEAEAA
jgi:hypothetical protein